MEAGLSEKADRCDAGPRHDSLEEIEIRQAPTGRDEALVEAADREEEAPRHRKRIALGDRTEEPACRRSCQRRDREQSIAVTRPVDAVQETILVRCRPSPLDELV